MFVEVDGLRVYVERAGTGPDVLLLHGWGSSARAFGQLTQTLSRFYSIWAFDFPGFGLSLLPPSPWGIEQHAEFVRHLMERFGLTRAHLLGHSFGGRVSISIAAQSPALVDRLVLVNSAGIRPPRTLTLRTRAAVARTGRRLLGHRLAGPAGQQALASLYRRLGMGDYATAGPLRATFVKIVNEDLAPLLPLIQAPTLLIWGARDRETPLWMGEQMAREIPYGELIVLPDAGHFSYVDARQEVEAAVLQFLADGAGEPC